MRPPLALLGTCVGLALAEALGLRVVHLTSALPLAPQASAVAPFGIFHDLRWLFTFASSWPDAAAMLLGALVGRSAIDLVIVRLAWPADRPPPSWPALARRTAVATAFALVLMAPWAASSFAGAATGFSPFMLLAMIGSAGTALLVPPAMVTGEYWRRLLAWRGMLLVGLQWVTLMLTSLAITFAPGWLAVAVAAAGGVPNALLWRHRVREALTSPAPRWRVPLAPLLAVVATVALVLAGAWISDLAYRTPAGDHIPARTVPQAAPPPGARVVLYVAGFDSFYHGERFELFDRRLATVHFSYRGQDSAGRPEPYGPQQTHQPLQVSAHRLAAQIATLVRGGHQVSVLAESEGTLVVATYLADHPHPPLHALVESSPLVGAARVYYPPPKRSGYGVLGGWTSRAFVRLTDAVGTPIEGGADMPFLRSLVDAAPTYRRQAMRPPAGVRSYLLLPMEGALAAPRGPLSAMPWTAFPAYHADLADQPPILAEVEQLVLGGRFRGRPAWDVVYQLVRGLAGAWQAPALPTDEWRSTA